MGLVEGKAADLVATKGDRKAAIEVETGMSDSLPDVQKCLDAGKDEVIVVVKFAQADRKIRAGLADISQVEVIEPPAALKQKW